MSSELIGRRLRVLRESSSVSQETVAKMLGINDRQTISAIETGHRRMSVDELLLAADVFNVSVDYFTDPFRLDGEGQFSWRSNGARPTELQEWETRAGSWIALFRTLSRQLDVKRPLLRHSLNLSKRSSFEDASGVGERFHAEFALGEYPSKGLREVMEGQLNYLVLCVDMGSNISGAACRVPDLDVVLVARDDIVGRRNFTLAHELFHVLTWESMPPSHIEETTGSSSNRVERLGDNFASALLMPSNLLERYGSWANLSIEHLIDKLNSTATDLGVTSQALKWRLVNVDSLDSTVAEAIPDGPLKNNGQDEAIKEAPLHFSKRFMKVIGNAIDYGHISVRLTAKLLGTTIDDLQELFYAHDVDCEIGL